MQDKKQHPWRRDRSRVIKFEKDKREFFKKHGKSKAYHLFSEKKVNHIDKTKNDYEDLS